MQVEDERKMAEQYKEQVATAGTFSRLSCSHLVLHDPLPLLTHCPVLGRQRKETPRSSSSRGSWKRQRKSPSASMPTAGSCSGN